MRLKILIVCALLFIGCLPEETGNAFSFIREDVKATQIYFCPRDNCETVLVDFINGSETSVHCALFDVDLDNVSRALAEKSKDIDVKVVMDNTNTNPQMSGKGIVYDTNAQLMHNKFCVSDGRYVLTGSFNPTFNDGYRNNNNVLVIFSKTLAENYEQEFEELWNYNFGKGHTNFQPIVYLNDKKYENYFCPEDSCQEKVLQELSDAQTSIYFMIFSFTDHDIAQALVDKTNLGLDVKGIVEAKRVTMQFEQYNYLFENKVFVKKDKNKYTLHHKVFIVDNKTVITGSYNPTNAADTKNDENIIIIHDSNITQMYLDEFNLLFS